METIKTKLIETNTNFVQDVKLILRENGPTGLYQGLTATILKQSSNQGFRFMAFNKYEELLMADVTGGAKLSALQVRTARTFGALGCEGDTAVLRAFLAKLRN